MKANVDAICYRSRPLKNGEFPLMLRITKSRQRKYVSLGLSVCAEHWDFTKNRPKRSCPNKEQIERLIAAKITEYNTLILDLATQQKPYTAESIVTALQTQAQFQTVHDLFTHLIADMRKTGKLGNAAVYRYAHDSLLGFTGGRLGIPFSDIDPAWLKRYESWLRARGCGETTLSQLFRTLRSLYNKAIELKMVKREYYPFTIFKISKFDTSTRKRAITKETVRRIIDLDLSKAWPNTRLARDLFVFSYFGAGINFTDMALLTWANVQQGRICYIRKKTGKPIQFPLTAETRVILDKYSKADMEPNDYLFPILDKRVHRTERQRYDRIHKMLTNTNRRLKDIGEQVGVDNLTTYVARHTFATVLKREGVSTSIICESLGHSSEKVTQIYLDSFENAQIDEAMKHLL